MRIKISGSYEEHLYPPFFPILLSKLRSSTLMIAPFRPPDRRFFIALTEQGTDISQNFHYQDSNM